MAGIIEHENQCWKILGKPFTEVHEFLDQFNKPETHPFTSVEHRKHFHHFGGLLLVAVIFRDMEAVYAAAIHILDDCAGYIPYHSDYQNHIVDMFGRPTINYEIDFRWYEKLRP